MLGVKRGLLCDEFVDELFEPINCDLIENRRLQPLIMRDLPVEGGALVAHDCFRIRANQPALAGQLVRLLLQDNCSREPRFISKTGVRSNLCDASDYRQDCRGGSSNLGIRALARQRDRFLKRIATHGRNDARSPAGDCGR